MPSKSSRILCFLSMACYAVSFLLPVLKNMNDETVSGWECFSQTYTEWYWAANPIIPIAWFFILRRHPMSIFISALALICAIGVAVLYTQSLPLNTLLAGYWMWAGSFLLAVIASAELVQVGRQLPT